MKNRFLHSKQLTYSIGLGLTILIGGFIGFTYLLVRQSQLDTALLHAVEQQNLKQVRLLLSQGADPNTTDPFGKPTLQQQLEGLFHPSHPLKGVSVSPAHGIEAPILIRAVEAGNVEIVRALLAQGAEVDAKSRDGETALGVAKREMDQANIWYDFINSRSQHQHTSRLQELRARALLNKQVLDRIILLLQQSEAKEE